MNKEDRETIIIVGIIMIVSTISLVAILYFFWQLVGPPLNSLITQIQYGVSVNVTNYNFEYPGMLINTNGQAQIVAKEPKPNYYQENKQKFLFLARFLKDPDYNFDYPERLFVKSSERIGFAGQSDELLTAEQIIALKEEEINHETGLAIEIKKIGVEAPLIQGYDYKEGVTKGLWILPGSKPVGEGMVIVLCQRRETLPVSGKSCWYLNELKPGDEILVLKNGVLKNKYQVLNSTINQANDSEIYKVENTNILKIITSDPLGFNNFRLVVKAQLVE